MRIMTTPLDSAVAQWAAAGWVVEQHTPTRAVMAGRRRPNHVAHGLFLAATVLLGGPSALCLGLGGVYAETENANPAAEWVLPFALGGWLLVVVVQAVVWARASRTVRRVLAVQADGSVGVT